MNPYTDCDFLDFFCLLFQRIFLFIKGDGAVCSLYSDEVQIFTLAFIGWSSALLGVFLVLRRAAMLANSLSHTILLGLVLTYLGMQFFLQTSEFLSLKSIITASILSAIFTTCASHFFKSKLGVRQDASIGFVFTALFALGILLLTVYMRHLHLGVEVLMGNVDALHYHDLWMACGIFLFNLSIVFLFYTPLKIVTFDNTFAKNVGIASSFFYYLLMLQTAFTAIVAFRAVGVVLFLSLLVIPVILGKLYTHKLRHLIFFSMGFSTLLALASVALSRHMLTVYGLALSTAGILVVLSGLVYFFHLGIKQLLAEKAKVMQRRKQTIL